MILYDSMLRKNIQPSQTVAFLFSRPYESELPSAFENKNIRHLADAFSSVTPGGFEPPTLRAEI